MYTVLLVGKPEGKKPLGRPCVGGRIILRWIFKKWDVVAWTGSSGSGEGQDTCECGNEPSVL
jgi:hypothetical protein